MPVTLHAASDHRAVQHIKRGEQRSRAMAFIVVLVWTAPDGIDSARMRSPLISDKGGRPWNRLAGLGWIVCCRDSGRAESGLREVS
jgi:hypothetical protein